VKNYIKVLYFRYKYRSKIKINSTISFDSELGEECVIESNSCISSSILGRVVYVGNHTRMFKSRIGSYSSIGPRVTIGENEHHSNYITTSNFLLNNKLKNLYFRNNEAPTTIGSDVWIGIGATIKKGVTIGHGAIIGAHALVTKDVAPYAIVGGVPAKFIRYRFGEETRQDLLNSRWWLYEKNDLNSLLKGIDLIDEEDMCTDFIKGISKIKNVNTEIC